MENSKSRPLTENDMPIIWEKLRGIYGDRLMQAFGSSMPGTWKSELIGKRTTEQVRNAFDTLKTEVSEYPPNMHGFLARCKSGFDTRNNDSPCNMPRNYERPPYEGKFKGWTPTRCREWMRAHVAAGKGLYGGVGEAVQDILDKEVKQ